MDSLLIDENLRGLGRWLRFLGFDARQAAGEKDGALLALADRERRIFFTRDHELAEHGAVKVRASRTPEQLAEVLERVGWPDERLWFTRCVLCNRPLREMPPAGGGRYWRCDECGRIYWRGSHYERSLAFLRRVRATR